MLSMKQRAHLSGEDGDMVRDIRQGYAMRTKEQGDAIDPKRAWRQTAVPFSLFPIKVSLLN